MRSDFFYTIEKNEPVIPGSSLRGMLRNIVRIVSYSKMAEFSEKKLFFRSMDKSSLRKEYSNRTVGLPDRDSKAVAEAKVKTGFMISNGERFVIRPCKMLRVSIEKLKREFSQIYESGNQPSSTVQYSRVWVKSDASKKYVEAIGRNQRNDFEKGILVITGAMKNKKSEFVFLMPDEPGPEQDLEVDKKLVDKKLIDAFHDREQITQWQEKSFPKGPNRTCDGYLPRVMNLIDSLQPIFFLEEQGKISAFGRAQMFRLPYTKTVKDFIPESIRKVDYIDFVDAIFGFVSNSNVEGAGGSPGTSALSGRVSVGDARLKEGQGTDLWLNNDREITPKVLSSPKPTAVQHYLVQQSDDIKELSHYDSRSPEETVPRGFKHYWHQGETNDESISLDELLNRISADPESVRKSPSQFTKPIRPLKPGIQFVFRLRFDNLNNRELGALCWALHPRGPEGREFRHKLGLGKPLGMGSVQLEATLHLCDQRKRYGALFADSDWETGISTVLELSNHETLRSQTEEFERDVISQVADANKIKNLYDLERIQCLLKLMEWPGRKPIPSGPLYLDEKGRANTRYMDVKEFKDRPVLPDPLGGSGGQAGVVPGTTTESTKMTMIAQKMLAAHAGKNPVQSTVTTKKEIATLLTIPKRGIAEIRINEDDATIRCTGMGNPWGKSPGAELIATVTRKDGKAIEAKFKGWH